MLPVLTKTHKFQVITVLALVLLAPGLVSGITYAQAITYPISGPITPPITPSITPTPVPVTPPVTPGPTATPIPVTPPVTPSATPTSTPIPVTPPVTPTPIPVTPPVNYNSNPVITTNSLPIAHRGKPYFASISFYDSNVQDSLKITISGLPTWLKLNKCTVSTNIFRKTYNCSYTGIPTKAGFYPLIVTVKDQAGGIATKLLFLSVNR